MPSILKLRDPILPTLVVKISQKSIEIGIAIGQEDIHAHPPIAIRQTRCFKISRHGNMGTPPLDASSVPASHSHLADEKCPGVSLTHRTHPASYP